MPGKQLPVVRAQLSRRAFAYSLCAFSPHLICAKGVRSHEIITAEVRPTSHVLPIEAPATAPKRRSSARWFIAHRSRQQHHYRDKESADEHFAAPCVWAPRLQSGPRMAHRESQNSFTAIVTPLLMTSRRSGEAILSSSSRLLIEPASSRTAGIRVFFSTMSLS